MDLSRVRVERMRNFGSPWVGYMWLQWLELPRFLAATVPMDGAAIPWPAVAPALVLGRFGTPSDELRPAQHVFDGGTLPDLLGVRAAKVNEDRLYRTLDTLLPHKTALELHLGCRLCELFALHSDLLLYEVASDRF